MNTHPVVFIAFEEFDNLGIGYMSSVLSKAGFKTGIIDFRYSKEEILQILLVEDPLLVGFSLIFQFHIDRFVELISYLRAHGVLCHFTAGGHYASLRYKELFELIPYLDSAVRFEGENTLLELAECIYSGSDWTNVTGIAYKNDRGEIISNPIRPLEKDLDNFPFPMRSALKEYVFNKKFAFILAGRGCVNDCAFCDIQHFYQAASGPAKRIRRPEMVVEEMEYLYTEKGCSVFLFQDDDFPVKVKNGSGWVECFCNELRRKGLKGKIIWKINCRPDEIDKETFAMMKEHGLFLVFLGIEDGTDSGLKKLNKHLTVLKSEGGIRILKELGVGFDYGFMLFQPSTTFQSIHDNLDFLRQLCNDGYTPITFLKLMPFIETRVEQELGKEGRLKGTPGFLDYDFGEESMNQYYNFITRVFMEWLRGSSGLLNASKWVRNCFLVYTYYFEPSQGIQTLSDNLTKTISKSNLFLLDTLKELAFFFESEEYRKGNTVFLKTIERKIDSKHKYFVKQINNKIITLSHNTDN